MMRAEASCTACSLPSVIWILQVPAKQTGNQGRQGFILINSESLEIAVQLIRNRNRDSLHVRKRLQCNAVLCHEHKSNFADRALKTPLSQLISL